jgi:hypothetical protein
MATTEQLINAIKSGDSADIQSTFNSVMAEKVQNALQVCRAAIIDQIFESTESTEDESAIDSSIDKSANTQ